MKKTKRFRWGNSYYLLIIGICALLALLIWGLFQSRLSQIEKEKQNGSTEKHHQP